MSASSSRVTLPVNSQLIHTCFGWWFQVMSKKLKESGERHGTHHRHYRHRRACGTDLLSIHFVA